MTSEEAIRLAEAEARKLGFPWDTGTAAASRRRLWPFPATWRVVSQVASPPARTLMAVSERRWVARPVGVLYPAARRALRRPLGPHLMLRLVLPALLGASAAYFAATLILEWPTWAACLVAAVWAFIAPIVWASIRLERSVDLTEK